MHSLLFHSNRRWCWYASTTAHAPPLICMPGSASGLTFWRPPHFMRRGRGGCSTTVPAATFFPQPVSSDRRGSAGIAKKARPVLRGDAGPEGLADVSIYLTLGLIPDKVGCHRAIVTDVTGKTGASCESSLSRLQNI